VSPQRLGAISSQELVGNVERSVQQSAMITEYLFDSHDEVKRRVYTALIECAKIAFRNGKKAQFVLDDMGIEMLDIEEFEFENSEFNVYMSNSNKDQRVVETLKQLSMEAMKADKADLSTLIDTVINDNPRDISATIKKGEQAKYERDKQAAEQKSQIEQQKLAAAKEMQAMELAEKQKDRDLKQYEIDTNNETKIQVASISAYIGQESLDADMNGIPDPMEIAAQALSEREADANHFRELHKLKVQEDKQKADKELKEKELNMKKEIEDKKIQAIKEQNKSQELMQEKDHKLKDYETRYLDNALYEIEASIKPIAMSKLPDMIVLPNKDDPESKETAEDITIIVDSDIKKRENRKTLGLAFKHLPVYFTGIIKARWNPEKNDFEFINVHPNNVVVDHTCSTNNADDMKFICEFVPITVQEILLTFPNKKTEFITALKKNGVIADLIISLISPSVTSTPALSIFEVDTNVLI